MQYIMVVFNLHVCILTLPSVVQEYNIQNGVAITAPTINYPNTWQGSRQLCLISESSTKQKPIHFEYSILW